MKKLINYVLFLTLLIILSCSSEFQNQQRIKQQNYTDTLAKMIKNYFDELINFIDNDSPNKTNINRTLFENFTNKYREVNCILLLNNELEIIKQYPLNYNRKVFEKLYTYDNRIKERLTRSGKRILSPYISGESKDLSIFVPVLTDSEITNYFVINLNAIQLFRQFEKQKIFPLPYSLMIINNKRQILYDSNPEFIGFDFTKIGTSLPQKPLQNLFKMMMENDKSFNRIIYELENNITERLFSWHAIPVCGSKLWVTLVRTIPPKIKKVNKKVFLLSTLRNYSTKDTLIDAVLENQPNNITGILKEIYLLNSDVYAIQFADSKGTILNGYPVHNSIIGYSIKNKKNKDFDQALNSTLKNNEMITITTSLLEGGEGSIIFMPVEVNNSVIGAIFSIEAGGG